MVFRPLEPCEDIIHSQSQPNHAISCSEVQQRFGQHGVDIKVPVTWSTERLGQGVSVLPEELSLSGQISSKLKESGHNVEVLNAGMIAQDSGGVRRIALEVLQYKPTGLIIYLGNNEGIGMVALGCKENNYLGYLK